MWRIDFKPHVDWVPPFVTLYEWECFFSSAGAAGGCTLTRRGAELELLKAQAFLFGSHG
jgi:hypothetical protein